LLRLAADVIVAVHAAFVVYVMLGGVLVLRWPRMAWAHVPAAIWGIAIELGGWMCPLTPIVSSAGRRIFLYPPDGMRSTGTSLFLMRSFKAGTSVESICFQIAS
jgi:Protein of Unknown function (DUF2784)